MSPPTTRRSGGTMLLIALVAAGMAVGILAIFFWVPAANCLVPGVAQGQPCFDARPDYIQHIFYCLNRITVQLCSDAVNWNGTTA